MTDDDKGSLKREESALGDILDELKARLQKALWSPSGGYFARIVPAQEEAVTAIDAILADVIARLPPAAEEVEKVARALALIAQAEVLGKILPTQTIFKPQ